MKLDFSKNDTLILKGVAIIFLLVHHCYCSVDRFSQYNIDFTPFSQSTIVYISSFLKICVGMFVFLSAFGMTKSLKKQNTNLDLSTKEFIVYTIKRYWNLWSKWIFLFALCELFGFIFSQRQFEVYGEGYKSIVYLIIDLLGFADLFHTPIFVATWWYMSLAFLLILIFPLVITLYRKYNILLIVTIIILPRLLESGSLPLIRWGLAIYLGVLCADKNILEKMKEFCFVKNNILNKFIKLILSILILILFIYLRESDNNYFSYGFKDGIVPFFMIYMAYEFLVSIPVLSQILAILGKHSMNIFLFHTFIRGVYFEGFTYSFGNAYLIVIILLLLSLAISIFIELLQKRLHYCSLCDRIQYNIVKKINIKFKKG